jgi:hypothetical protein
VIKPMLQNHRAYTDLPNDRKKDGTPWSKLYQKDMALCEGFEQNIPTTGDKKEGLPCHPATVIYGHAASRGLDIKRWTIGLDSGCVSTDRCQDELQLILFRSTIVDCLHSSLEVNMLERL